MTYLCLLLLNIYKRGISPFLPVACRFYPTCGDFMADAIRLHGLTRGLWLGTKRLLRCHPFGGCGCDPVPSFPSHSKPVKALSKS